MPRKKLPLWRFADAEGREDLRDVIHRSLQELPELSVLGDGRLSDFASELEEAVRFARAGFPTQRGDVFGGKETSQILAADVQLAMRAQSLKVASWRQDTRHRDPEAGEALFYRILRVIAPLGGVFIPVDAYPLKKRSDAVEYGRGGNRTIS